MSQHQMIDRLIEALEDMIDARDDMWEEEKHCNYKMMQNIKEERYDPAKDQIRRLLTLFIEDVIKKHRYF